MQSDNSLSHIVGTSAYASCLQPREKKMSTPKKILKMDNGKNRAYESPSWSSMLRERVTFDSYYRFSTIVSVEDDDKGKEEKIQEVSEPTVREDGGSVLPYPESRATFNVPGAIMKTKEPPKDPAVLRLELTRLLNQHFKLDSFRQWQLEIIISILQGHDVFVNMNTGYGKSLIYMMISVYLEDKLIVVVSPLLSLMQDQLQIMKNLNINAAKVCCDLNDKEKGIVYDLLAGHKLNVLLITPEGLVSNATVRQLLHMEHGTGRFRYIFIDECHCVMDWGYSFRASYGVLGGFIHKNWPDIGVCALTATSVPTTSLCIIENLKLKNVKTFVGSFDRANIRYTFIRVPPAPEGSRESSRIRILNLVYHIVNGRFLDQSGIIYVITTAEAEWYSRELGVLGLSCDYYHDQRTKPGRARAQHLWMNNEVKLMIATSSFGMGINHPNVRYVIHIGVPWAMENYHQQSGRAGRDGLPSESIIIFNVVSDVKRLLFISNECNSEPLFAESLRKIVIFLHEEAACRRGKLAKHFTHNERLTQCTPNLAYSCDVCRIDKDYRTTVDVGLTAKNIVRTVTHLRASGVTVNLRQLVLIMMRRKLKNATCEMKKALSVLHLSKIKYESDYQVLTSIVISLIKTQHLNFVIHGGSELLMQIIPGVNHAEALGVSFEYKIVTWSENAKNILYSTDYSKIVNFYFPVGSGTTQ